VIITTAITTSKTIVVDPRAIALNPVLRCRVFSIFSKPSFAKSGISLLNTGYSVRQVLRFTKMSANRHRSLTVFSWSAVENVNRLAESPAFEIQASATVNFTLPLPVRPGLAPAYRFQRQEMI
jgi:hypothetical protein